MSNVGPRWRKSSYSIESPDICVEVAALAGSSVGVRDSKLGDRSPVLSMTGGQFAALLDGVRTGQIA